MIRIQPILKKHFLRNITCTYILLCFRNALRKKEANDDTKTIAKVSYSKKTMICLSCKKLYVSEVALRGHMARAHDAPKYLIQPDNYLNVAGPEPVFEPQQIVR